VEPTLHISSNGKFGSDGSLHNIFALGDVAATGGAKMARAGMMQAEIVCTNILALITGGNFRSYVPSPLESSLKLSLGKVCY
jgi:NADH dehydrogenase FAD-containing subunit